MKLSKILIKSKMSSKQLIAFALISLIESMSSSPNLCSKELTSFTVITQMVNNSYLITDHRRRYSIFQKEFTNFSRDYSKIKTLSDNTLSAHNFLFDTIFVIDIDGHCVNIEEKLFVIDVRLQTLLELKLIIICKLLS